MKLFTLTDLAYEYKKDLTYVAKLVKEYNLDVTKAIQNNHPCQALTQKEKSKLEKLNPLLALPAIAKGEIEINELAELRGQTVGGLLKFLKAHEYGLEQRLREGGGRPCNVLTAKEYVRFLKENPPRVKVK